MKTEKHKACVFLPSPFTDSVEYYEKYREFGLSNFKVDTSERFLDVDFLTDLRYAFLFKNAFKGDT